MRDVNRIDRVMSEFTEIWKTYPDWRFGQLISNVVGEILHNNNKTDMFFPEDDFWEEELKKYLTSHGNLNYGQNLLK